MVDRLQQQIHRTYRITGDGMIKWFANSTHCARLSRPAAFFGRAGLTLGLVLTSLAWTPPAGTSISSAIRRTPDNRGSAFAAAPLTTHGPAIYSGSTRPDYRRDIISRYITAHYITAHYITAHYSTAHYSTATIPAFARKYSLPCSACHTTWPELNSFGQKFRDNGYQLGNDRDAPIWQNPSYYPMAIRTTPQWHMERTTHQPVDAVRGDATGGTVERTITQQGFDISGVDLLFIGTLHKNISFGFIPSADNAGSFHLEAAYVRLDDLLNTHWANLKLGKFELDNLVSEKRFLFLSPNGGIYQSYHFAPVGDANAFGLGDNQIGLETSGHSANSYTRYGAAILASTDGEVGLPGGHGYDAAFTFSQAFDAGSLGVQRVGAYAYLGQRPTTYETVGGEAIPGTGTMNKSFQRIGVAGDFFFGDLEFLPLYLHASDDAFLGTATPGDQQLPPGARAPTWNGGFLETHYYVNPQLVFTQRIEFIRMSRQALTTTPTNLGNIDAYTFGYRWYPMMTSRAGLAWHTEYSMVKTLGAVPLSGLGVGLPPLSPATAVWSRSLLLALDFAF
jgi:hypothetical protein